MVTREELEKMSPEEIAELQKKNCIFCKLIAGEIPSNKVFDDSFVISILDINPSTRGHLLVLPKEHIPILPLLPPNQFQQLFIDAKLIAKGLKEATLSSKLTLFVANGAVAGQQASHFLFHLIPRNDGDSLSNFNIIPNPDLLKAQEELFPSLKNNISLMMQNHFKKLGIPPPSSQQGSNSDASENPSASSTSTPIPASNSTPVISPEDAEKKRSLVLKIIDANKDARDLLKKSPEEFAELLKQNSELSEIFSGVDLKVLSEKLKQIPESSFSNGQQTSVSDPVSSPVQNSQNSVSENNLETSSTNSSVISSESSSENNISATKNISTVKDVEDEKSVFNKIFKGSDPESRYKTLMDYFSEKQKAKELFINDLSSFKSLLSKRPDVAKLFEDVDLDLFSEFLKNSEKEKTSVQETPGITSYLSRGDSDD